MRSDITNYIGLSELYPCLQGIQVSCSQALPLTYSIVGLSLMKFKINSYGVYARQYLITAINNSNVINSINENIFVC